MPNRNKKGLPLERRRLLAEKALSRWNTYEEASRELEKYALEHNSDYTFNPNVLRRWVLCYRNQADISAKRLAVIARCTGYRAEDLAQIFVAPLDRGEGQFWVCPETGALCRDMDYHIKKETITIAELEQIEEVLKIVTQKQNPTA